MKGIVKAISRNVYKKLPSRLQSQIVWLVRHRGASQEARSYGSLEKQIGFLLYEVARLNERNRRADFPLDLKTERLQTKASFDYQWEKLNQGKALPSDDAFMKNVTKTICEYTGLPASWFKGKKIADVGCGMGRFTYGLLSLGAKVTALDQSPNALEQVKILCKDYADNLTVRQLDLLNCQDDGQRYDLVYCYGVVHHTGNTYKAMYNVAKMVADHGKLFMMIYSYPKKPEDFIALLAYEKYREKLRNLSFDEKVKFLKAEFDPEYVHGWFDAVSPQINDLLSFEEIVDFLHQCGFHNIKRTMDYNNHHVVAEKR